MSAEVLRSLNTIVESVCIERKDYTSLAEWQKIKEVYGEEMPKRREEVKQLQEQVEQLSVAPLQYAIYLGPCLDDTQNLIVGVGGTRIEVRGAEGVGLSADKLTPGQLVVLNKEQSIVDVRQEYICGETAEVVNVIKGEEEAEVIVVLEGSPQEPKKLQVRWREKEEIAVTCSDELTRQGVQRGTIVRIDPDQHMAIAKAKPRLHVKVGGNEGTVVEISDSLALQGVQIGDIVRIELGLKFAFEKLPAYETGKLTLEDVPDVTYDDIGGLDEQISQIYDTIEMPYLFRDQFEDYQLVRPKGILLYGPPGCGKTMVAKAVANSLTKNIRTHLTDLERYILLYKRMQQQPDDPELPTLFNALPISKDSSQEERQERFADMAMAKLGQLLQQYDIDPQRLDEKLQEIRAVLTKQDGVRSFFLNVKGPELLDKYVGETEHRIRKIFEEARRHSSYYTPVIIFFDEMEAMFRTRGSGRSSDIETTIVPQFLAELDGVESIENLVIIGASNRQDMIDPAILRPGRLDVKIKVDRPSSASAQDIFTMYLLPTLPLNEDGIILPSVTESSGEVIFRTAYQSAHTSKQRMEIESRAHAIGPCLPKGSDLRLLRRLEEADLKVLADMPPKYTVREAMLLLGDGHVLRNKLSSFKTDLELGELVSKLSMFLARIAQDAAFQRDVEYFVHQEWLAETMILQAVTLLYSSSSTISALTNTGSRHIFPFKDFVTGAIITNIVTRAKRQAIKRALLDQTPAHRGISLADLTEGIRKEFEENKEQLVQQRLRELGHMTEDIQSAEINMNSSENDLWSEEKIPLPIPTSILVAIE